MCLSSIASPLASFYCIPFVINANYNGRTHERTALLCACVYFVVVRFWFGPYHTHIASEWGTAVCISRAWIVYLCIHMYHIQWLCFWYSVTNGTNNKKSSSLLMPRIFNCKSVRMQKICGHIFMRGICMKCARIWWLRHHHGIFDINSTIRSIVCGRLRCAETQTSTAIQSTVVCRHWHFSIPSQFILP